MSASPRVLLMVTGGIAAFMGAFFRSAPLMADHGLDEDRLFEGIGAQMNKKFGHLGESVVEQNITIIKNIKEVWERSIIITRYGRG